MTAIAFDPEGWSPVFRRIVRSEVWKGQTATTKVVLVWLILAIRHTTTNGTPAGSVDVTIDAIGEACDTSRVTTRAALAALTAVGFITSSRSRWGLRITISNWKRWLNPKRHDEESRPLTSRTPDADAIESPSLSDDAQNSDIRRTTVVPPIITVKEVREGSDPSPTRDQLDARRETVALTAKVEGYSETIADFHERFVKAYGSKPTWGPGQGKQLKRLLVAHGAAEVQRRIRILFEQPPRWLQPPFSFGTLVSNFDRLAMAVVAGPTQGRRGGLTVRETMDLAARMGVEKP